ncbi:double-strand break repair helicase AddA [Elioraea sp.]|uniref:double-strand break repair helicase AddA n=1 Tax=Elioraea sp. TaxID=2185103 RepID=UPI0025C3DC84|nr:double-strand break repair helicase AddA [Elioraea sp.]
MTTLDPRGEAIAAQRRAADPAVSAWVGASAGSGKTTLLTNRVLRLLLGGCEPGRILCLTYTRAAAAEMATRLGARLGQWAALDDAALAEALDDLGVAADSATMARARGLFARVLDQPGGLRIATIHAFCQSLLRRFPIEAAVAPHFALIEERDQAELLAAARDQALGEQTAGIAAALETVAPLVDDARFAGLVTGVLGARGRVSRALAAEQGVTEMQRRALSLGDDETEESILAVACARDLTRLSRAAAALALGGVDDQKCSIALREWLAADAPARATGWDRWRGVFIKQDGDIRTRLASKKAIAVMPDILDVMGTEATFVLDTEAKLRAARAARASSALMRLVSPVIAAYARRKHIRAGLDYEDLITCARTLLGNTDTAWVQYKLDGGLDHVLLDEAQDTSPAQWDVVEKLTAEFFSGLGARDDLARTLFAVGDVKQSIYRFQGAAPVLFSAAREKAASRVTAMHGSSHFRAEQLAVSFRSTAPVLALVDAVFADPTAAKGVALDGGAITHRPARTGQAGSVTLWPLVASDPTPEDTTWEPEPSKRARKGEEKLAETIAAAIEAWVGTEILPARERTMRAGDIVVLVRHRGVFVGQLVRALKRRGVPVSGIDRMRLVTELAVMDVLATLDALLLPEDDLTFACALRSPIFGISDASLMDLAVGRGRRSLRDTLRRRAGERDEWRAAEDLFSALAARADFDTPHALIARLLGPLGGRARLLARLGPDAADPLDELMNTALAHEHAHPPNLQGFLAWLRAGAAEIKREQEAGADAVRVMTVHGAKGLESPVVILADTTAIAGKVAPLVWVKDAASGDDVPLWSPRNEFRAAPIAAAREVESDAEHEEYRRLLYVALTRAEDRLVITGALSRKSPGKDAGCWYDLVEAGFHRLAGEGAAPITFDPGALIGEPGWTSGGWHYATAQAPGAERRREAEGATASSRAVVPAWARAAPPGEETPPRPLAPSREEGEDPPAASPRGRARSEARFRRGTLVHALLQHLPAVPPDRRAAAARAWLAAPGQGLGAAEVEEIAAETLAIITGERFAALFAPDALAEAPIAGRIGARVVAGQVDRLAITDSAVLVADFKTNRPPPERVEDVASVYLRQMAAYRAVLRQVFPGRAVTCALVWTYAARMMELPDALLDAHAPAPM